MSGGPFLFLWVQEHFSALTVVCPFCLPFPQSWSVTYYICYYICVFDEFGQYVANARHTKQLVVLGQINASLAPLIVSVSVEYRLAYAFPPCHLPITADA